LPVRFLAAVALTLCAAVPARAGSLFDDLDAVAAELRADEPSRRRDAVDKLDAYRTDEVRRYLLSALDDGDTEVRARAALAIGRRRLAEAAPRLLALMGDPEPRLRAVAAAALGQVAGVADAPWPAQAAHALERALGDAEHDVREAAVEAIGALPRPLAQAAAVGVTGRLDDDHPTVRQKAAVVLARLGEARAVIPLVGRLSDGSREVRMAALEALGELGDARAAPAMIRLMTDSAEEVREQAIQSLGRLKARVAVAPLAELFEHGLDPLRGRAAVALGQVASAPPAGGPDPAVATLVAALSRDELRQPAREGLRLAGAGAVGPIAARLPSATGDELAVEVELLGELRDPRAVPVLLAELANGRLARERVVDALGQVARGDRELVVELAALLGDKELAVRRRAAHALVGLVDARAASALAEAAGDSDREVRLLAIGELGRLKAASAAPALAKALASTDAETAAAAARALGELGDRRSAAALEAALGRSDPRVRRDAADALGRLGDSSLVPAVMRRAKSGGAERSEAIAALAGLLRGRPDPIARELLLGHAESGDTTLAVEAIDALAATHDGAAGGRLERLLQKRDSELRRHAARALGDSGGGEDVEAALVARLADDADPGVRAEAAWALGKLKGGAPSLAALERALTSPAAELRANAAASLARLGHAPQGLSRLLHDPDSAVRANAQLALGHAPHPAPGGDWIGLYLVDFDGAPLSGARYRLILPDGLIKAGQADARGVIREESLPKGACRIELVDEPAGRS
jgi:HEAT repeat protein